MMLLTICIHCTVTQCHHGVDLHFARAYAEQIGWTHNGVDDEIDRTWMCAECAEAERVAELRRQRVNVARFKIDKA